MGAFESELVNHGVGQRVRLIFKSSAGLFVLVGFVGFLVSFAAAVILNSERIRLANEVITTKKTLVELLYSSNEQADAIRNALNNARLAATSLPSASEREKIDEAITQSFSSVARLKSDLFAIQKLLAQRGLTLEPKRTRNRIGHSA